MRRERLVSLLAAALALLTLHAGAEAPGIITTVAGTGAHGYSGDGGSAIQAELDLPGGLAVDGAGSLLIADRGNERIRKVDPQGTISTTADDPAIERGPYGVAADPEGNLFVAVVDQHRVVRVGPDGTLITVAGSGPVGGDKGDFAGDGGPATEARLNIPNGVAVDSEGNLFIADTWNHRIRKVSTDGTISTVAGSGPVGEAGGGFSGDDGPAIDAELHFPNGVAVDGEGNLFVADSANHRIRKVSADGIITTVVGSGRTGIDGGGFSGDGGPATAARLYVPISAAVDGAGNLFIADFANQRIRKVSADGTITTVAGSGPVGLSGGGYTGDGGPATAARLDQPFSVTVDRAGNLFIADGNNNRIRKVSGAAAPGLLAGRPFP